jgi:hypothetical protein
VPVEQRGPGSDVLIVGDTTSVVIPFGSLVVLVLPVLGCLYLLEVSDGRVPPAASAASPTGVASCARAY